MGESGIGEKWKWGKVFFLKKEFRFSRDAIRYKTNRTYQKYVAKKGKVKALTLRKRVRRFSLLYWSDLPGASWVFWQTASRGMNEGKTAIPPYRLLGCFLSDDLAVNLFTKILGCNIFPNFQEVFPTFH